MHNVSILKTSTLRWAFPLKWVGNSKYHCRSY